MATGGVGPPTEELGEAPGPDESRDETERRIDNMNFMTTIKEGKQLGIDFKSYNAQKLQVRQWLIKWKTMCSSTTDIKPADILRTIEDDASLDTERRKELIKEFERAEQLQRTMVQSEDEMLIDQLGKNGYGNDELFKEEITKLTDAKAPVLVFGETGSGKTSFINLLLGEKYFQHSILSNTHVVSKIQYGPEPKAILYDLEHRPVKKIPDQADLRPFKDQLSDHDTRSHNGRPVYSQADIYLPCEILKCGLVIVDSPGIGESDEMKQMVLDYFLTACTFIYVIDSMTTGGVQMRMRELLNEAYKKAIEDDKIYNPATAIFICNKWDMVPKEHKQAAWSDTIRKIKEVWPYCKTEEQIFMFSTREAAYIQDLGGVAPKYLKVLHKINELLPLGREMLVWKSYNKLERFYNRMLMIMRSFMHQKDEPDFQRQTRIGHIQVRLESADKSIKEYFIKSTKWLKEEQTKKAYALKQYLNQSKTEICTIPGSQLPTAEEWEKASIQIQLLVGENVQNQMTKWLEKNAPFKELSLAIYKGISESFPKFQKELSEIQMNISPFKAKNVNVHSEEEGSVGEKIAFRALMSPQMLFSGVVHGSVKVGLMIKNAFTDHFKQKKNSKAYSTNADKKLICEDYAHEIVTRVLNSIDYNDIIRENIEQSFTLLKTLEQRMLQAVKQDKDSLKTLQQEKRSDKEITDTYQPLITQMEQGLTALHVFNVKVFGKCEDIVEDIQKFEPAVWSAAQMFKATSVKPFQTKNHQTVCVRKPNANDKVTERIKVLTAYRNLSHKSLVEYCGIVMIEQTTCQLMPPLVQSLRSFMSNVRSVDKRRSCFLALKDVTSGLKYLHGEGFVHFDLSLDTVFTDCHGQFKLTNIHPETSVRIPLLRNAEGFVYPAHYVHLPLKFLRSSHEPDIQYTARDDVYSLGIMMWEMFLGDHLVALGSKLNQGLGESEFEVGGWGSEFQGESEFQVGGRSSVFQVGGRGSEFQVSGQGSEFQLGVQESEFQVGGRGSEFQVSGRGSGLHVGDQGSEFQVSGRGSGLHVGDQGSEFQVSGRGSGLHVGDKGSEFQVSGRGSGLHVGDQGSEFQVGGRGSGLHVGGQGSEFQIGGRGSEFQVGGRGSEFQVGGRLEPDSQHLTHDLAGGISAADEAHIFELLHETLKKQIDARKEKLKSRKLSDTFWEKWRSILLVCIEQTHSVNQIAGELNSLKIVLIRDVTA